MRKFALVCAGGFCGALTRYLLVAPILALAARLPRLPGVSGAFPYDVLLINLTGALALGVIYGLVERRIHVAHDLRLLLGTGFLGAYTTFSSYVYGGVLLLPTGAWLAGALYLVGSLAAGLLCAQLGFWLAGAFSQTQRRGQPAVIHAMGTPIAEALAAINRRLSWDDTGPLLAREPGSADDEYDENDERDDQDDLMEEELI